MENLALGVGVVNVGGVGAAARGALIWLSRGPELAPKPTGIRSVSTLPEAKYRVQ